MEEPRKEPIVIDGDRLYLGGMMEEYPELQDMMAEAADAFVERMKIARQEIRDGAPWTRAKGEAEQERSTPPPNHPGPSTRPTPGPQPQPSPATPRRENSPATTPPPPPPGSPDRERRSARLS